MRELLGRDCGREQRLLCGRGRRRGHGRRLGCGGVDWSTVVPVDQAKCERDETEDDDDQQDGGELSESPEARGWQTRNAPAYRQWLDAAVGGDRGRGDAERLGQRSAVHEVLP